MEVDGRMKLGEAHELATRLETAIEDEVGPDIEVETHIEPMETTRSLRPRRRCSVDRTEIAATLVENRRRARPIAKYP